MIMPELAYQPFDSKSKALNFRAVGAADRRAQAATRYRNVETGISVREGLSYEDRDFFSPEAAPPKDPIGKMAACMQAAESIGIVKNTIDMMGEFTCQGADLVHPQPGIEKFYREWFRKVGGPSVTERFLNLFYRSGNAPVKKTWATLSVAQQDLLRQGIAPEDAAFPAPEAPRKVRVPWVYTVLNPLSLEVMASPDLSPLVGKTALNFGVRINKTLLDQLREGKKNRSKFYVSYAKQVDSLLSECGGGELVAISPADFTFLQYKKDDWQIWATPMLFPIYRDLQMLNQLKMADSAALAGAISQIRVWKLGDLTTNPILYPGQPLIERFGDVISAAGNGGPLDVIWTPDIDLLETSTDVHKFLGQEKYAPTLAAIYGGLGIPPTLTGMPGGGAGTTNNYVSLKTLVERLEYGRRVAGEFWDQEIRLVQKAMGFRFPATLVFDQHSLSDEAAQLRLLVELLDRGVISREAVLERFGFVPEIEGVRTKREKRMEKSNRLPERLGPFADYQKEGRKLFIQTKTVTPSEVGVDLEEKDPAQVAPIETEAKLAPKPASPKGKPGQGRPPGKKDKSKRKSPSFSPRSGASAELLVKSRFAGKRVRELLAGEYLDTVSKKKLTQLTTGEARGLEELCFLAHSNLDLNAPVTEESIFTAASLSDIPGLMVEIRDRMVTGLPGGFPGGTPHWRN
jgi:hypothetical protein